MLKRKFPVLMVAGSVREDAGNLQSVMLGSR